MPFHAQFFKHADGVGYTAVQRIVGINKQQAVIGIHFRVCFERLVLACVVHHPAVRHRSRHGYVEHLPGNDVGSGTATADDRRARTVNARVRSLSATKPEFHHHAALRRATDFCRFGGDQRLVVDDIQQRRFGKLRLNQRRLDCENRLARKYRFSLFHRVHVARETQVFKILQKFFVERVQRTEIGNIVLGKMPVQKIIHRLFQPCEQRIGNHFVLTEEDIEHHFFLVLFLFEKAVAHCNFVKIRQ